MTSKEHYWLVLARSGTAGSYWLKAGAKCVVLFCGGHC